MPPATESRGGILEKLSTRSSDFRALFTSLSANARASQSWPS